MSARGRLGAQAVNSKLSETQLRMRMKTLNQRMRDKIPFEQRQEWAKANGAVGGRARAAKTPKELSEITRKGWETRRRRYTPDQIAAQYEQRTQTKARHSNSERVTT